MALVAIGLAASSLGAVSGSFTTRTAQIELSHISPSQNVSYLRSTALLTTLQASASSAQAVRQEVEQEQQPPSEEEKLAAESEPATTAEPTPEPRPAYFTYSIQPGDTIEGIAAAFGIDPEYILWNNPDVSSDPDLLMIGQKLLIPSVNGLVYTVKLGDTLTDIAEFYQIDLQNIVAFVPNGIASPDMVTEGMVLVLPGAEPPPPPPMPAAVQVLEASAPTAEPTEEPLPQPTEEPTPEPTPEPPPRPQPVVAVAGFIWPFSGPVSSYFGEPRGNGSYHMGIDIDAFGQYGAPVVAAGGGQVVLASYSDYGLGYYIVVRHGDGLETVYAHLSEIYVAQGQEVAQGETIGAIGCTGYCTGPHLHFEVLLNGVNVDPLDYLP